MPKTPNFSVALIARNESKTLPRLVKSLAEFQERGGEIILLDTGSTDGTADIARELGCKVTEVGNRFQRVITAKEAGFINNDYTVPGEEDLVKEGDTLFDYSSARNFAATLASNDMVATPDCDEIYTKLDIDIVCEKIAAGIEQLEYNFVYSHDDEGGELVKFMHSKFYNRTKQKWVGIIHEVLAGEAKREFLEENVIKLEHWQNPETNRGHYLKGLALSVLIEPGNDRNLHYFGRELMYSGRPRSAIKVLEQHVALQKWPAERSQSQIHIGDCYMSLGNPQKAIYSYIDAFDTFPHRREPLMKVAEYYRHVGSVDHVLSYTAAAMQIMGQDFYANYQPYYEYVPHELMYWALWEKKEYNASKRHFDQCLAYQPFNPKYLHDFGNYYELPTITILSQGATATNISRLDYPSEKILEDNSADWRVYVPEGYTLESDAILCAFKQASDNKKYFIGFNDGEIDSHKSFMIHKKLIEKIKNFDELMSKENFSDLIWEEMKKLSQAMVCGRAKININKK